MPCVAVRLPARTYGALLRSYEEVALTHRATSRRIFAAGAVSAAKKIVSREAGFYSFDELMFG